MCSDTTVCLWRWCASITSRALGVLEIGQRRREGSVSGFSAHARTTTRRPSSSRGAELAHHLRRGVARRDVADHPGHAVALVELARAARAPPTDRRCASQSLTRLDLSRTPRSGVMQLARVVELIGELVLPVRQRAHAGIGVDADVTVRGSPSFGRSASSVAGRFFVRSATCSLSWGPPHATVSTARAQATARDMPGLSPLICGRASRRMRSCYCSTNGSLPTARTRARTPRPPATSVRISDDDGTSGELSSPRSIA